jgi:hypothetical protein
MVQVNAKIEINLMLEPSIVKIQQALKGEKGYLETQAVANWLYNRFVVADFVFCSGQVTMVNTLKIEDKL